MVYSIIKLVVPEEIKISSKIKLYGFYHTAIAGSIFIFFTMIYLFGNGAHSLWDADEARFSTATIEMLRNGDFIIPHLNQAIRYDKPILIYWLMSVPVRLFGVNEFSVRLIQSLSGAAALSLLYLLAISMGCRIKGALLSVIFCGFSLMYIVVSNAATTDAVIALTIMFCMLCWWNQMLLGFTWSRHVGFWLAMGLGVLTKGPPTPLYVASAILGFYLLSQYVLEDRFKPRLQKSWPNPPLRISIGLIILCAVTLPWAIPAWLQTNGEFFGVSVGKHVVGRTQSAMEGHSGPIIYYLGALPLDTIPGIALFIMAIRYAWLKYRIKPEVLVLVCWIIIPFIVLSIVATKLPHYVVPMLPAFGILIGLWYSGSLCSKEEKGNILWWRIPACVLILLGLVIAIGLPVACYVEGFKAQLFPAIFIGIVWGGFIIIGAIYWWLQRWKRSIAFWYVGQLLVILILGSWVLPSLEPLRGSKVVANWIKQNLPENTKVSASHYREASLFFYLNDYVELLDKHQAIPSMERLADPSEPFTLVITQSRWENWVDRYNKVPHPGTVVFNEEFYNFNKGKWYNLLVVTNIENESRN